MQKKINAIGAILATGGLRVCGKSDMTWRYVGNLGPCLRYRRTPRPDGSAQTDLLAKLRRDGVAMTTVEELFGDSALLEELNAAVQGLECERREEIDLARASCADASNQVKTYLVKLLGSRPPLNPDDIFGRMALHPATLSMVNDYFGMWAMLRHYNVWHNVPSAAEPRESQLWHRDPEDRHVLKMFIYLTDVDEGSGALTYAPGTHMLGSIRKDAPARKYQEGRETVLRTDDLQMASIVPRRDWVTASGGRGTVVFSDTRGYHKGGQVRERDRIVYVCMFTSRASWFRYDLFGDRLLSPAQYPVNRDIKKTVSRKL